MKTTSDGSTASYYELPKGCTELQDLISYRNLNAQDGEIFRAIYRKGLASHSDALRDAKKVLFYATAEVKRLEATVKESLTVDLTGVFTAPSSDTASPVAHGGVTNADGWIKWDGGECPVALGVVCSLLYRDGKEVRTASANSHVGWAKSNDPYSIIAYRIHKAGE